MESQITKTENLFLPCVKNVLRAAREGIDQDDLSSVKAIRDDIRICGLFLLHLAYRSPQWLGEDFFSGLDAIQNRSEKAGKDLASIIREESTKLIQASELVMVISHVDSPTFVLGDCGPFVSQDMELGVDNERRKWNDPNWIPAEQRIWMAFSPDVALGVAMRNADATIFLDPIPDSKLSANWVDHFNEICARQSRMIAGPSEKWVCAASRKAWPME